MKLDPAVSERYPGFIAGYVRVSGVTIEKEVEPLTKCRIRILSEIKSKYQGVQITSIPEVQVYRSFFKLMGRDPSSFHPPPEYLLRSALKDKFPSINNLVDSCLLASLQSMVSGGVYDVQKLKGEVRTTLATGDEKPFELIDGRRLAPLLGEVILRDDQRIVSAYTLGDSKVPKITYSTSTALVILWNAPGIPRERVEQAVENVSLYARKYCGGHVDEKRIL
jgi:DNA/RNA-binding domain of Phe-tRNA-synthetase-like protein